MENYPTKKIRFNHVGEKWSVAVMDLSDYKKSNKKEFRDVFSKIDIFSKHTWCIPMMSKNAQLITDDSSRTVPTSNGTPLKIKSNRGKEYQNSIFQKLLRQNGIYHYSRFSDKGPAIPKTVARTKKNSKETKEKVTHVTISSNRINYSPERYNENLSRSTKLTLGEIDQVVKKQIHFKKDTARRWN